MFQGQLIKTKLYLTPTPCKDNSIKLNLPYDVYYLKKKHFLMTFKVITKIKKRQKSLLHFTEFNY